MRTFQSLHCLHSLHDEGSVSSKWNERIDIVDVFRKSEDIPAVIDDVLKKKEGIKLFWMKLGIYNEDAERKAKKNGIDVVYNRCMLEEHERLFDEEE